MTVKQSSSAAALWLTAGAGAIIAASQIALALLAPGFTHATAMSVASVAPLIALLAIPTAIGIAAATRLNDLADAHRALIAIIALGAAIRLLWFCAPPMIEDDFYRYLWDGAVLAHGFSPYAHSPEQALSGLALPPKLHRLAIEGQQVVSAINFPDLRTIYPGTAQAVFAAAHLVAPWDPAGLRIALFGAEAATLVLLIALLGRLGLSPQWSALYWCNPFVATAIVGQIHADGLLPPLMLGALLLASRRRFAFAAGLLALAAGVKLWPVLLAPLLLRPVLFDIRRLLAAGAVMGAALALLIGPLLLASLGGEQAGLNAYSTGWANNNAPYAWTLWWLQQLFADGFAVERLLRAALAVAAGAIAIAVAIRPAATPVALVERALIVAAAVFYLSPVQFPWYAVWFLPLAVLTRNWPLLAASALLPAYYLFFPYWQTQRGEIFIYGAAFIHSLPIFAWLAWRWWRAQDTGAMRLAPRGSA